MDLIPLDVGSDISAFFAEFGPIIVLIIAMFVAMLYGLAYFSRFIEYQKLKEHKYLDERILSMIDKVVHWVIIFLVIMLSLLAIQFKSPAVKGALVEFFYYFPSIFVVIVILFIVFVLVRVLSRLMSSLRRQVTKGERLVEPPRFLSLTEILLKYTIYTIGIIFAVFGGLAFLPSGSIKDWVVVNIFNPLSDKWTSFAFVVLTLVIAYLLYLFVDSVLEDIKKRSKKFSPRVIDVFRSISRYLFIIITSAVVALILIGIVVTGTGLYVIAIGFVVTMTAILVVLAGPVKNILSGIVLMMSDPFDEGDRVKILDNLVCDVLEMNLTLTVVKSLKGEIISIPNGEIMSKSIVNFTRSGTYAMTVEVKVSYEVAHEKVEEILLAAAEKTSGISDKPEPQVFGKDVEGNVIIHQLLAYIRHPENMKNVKSQLVYHIQELFHEKGIKVLFPD
ncbi:MAG: mechanosensitive ion channel [Methanobacteriota archaeon]|nr:MAG: mechanosensitive ion channel [Euryarchaeota archaeon]